MSTEPNNNAKTIVDAAKAVLRDHLGFPVVPSQQVTKAVLNESSKIWDDIADAAQAAAEDRVINNDFITGYITALRDVATGSRNLAEEIK